MTQPPMVYRDGEFIACEPLTEFEDYWFAPPGVHPPELAFDPIPFFKELEGRDIYTRVSVTESV